MGSVEEVHEKIMSALRAVEGLPYDGEPVSQLQHALQCAALAHDSGAGPELVAAALLHDVGRSPVVLNEVGVGRDHGEIARRWLAPLVGDRVAWLAQGHVPAKRYLVATDPDYERALSDTSRRTLERQGGPMSPEEVAEFEGHPGWRDAVALRRWDDLGKDPETEVPPLEAYVAVVEAVVGAARAQNLSRQGVPDRVKE